MNSDLQKRQPSDEKDRPVAAAVHDDLVSVTLADGRIITNPLEWHPWLAQATEQQQSHVEYHAFSVDWPDLDEGLDIQGMLQGIQSVTLHTNGEHN